METSLKAIILRGKYKGTEVEISQWCNDWFTVEHEDPELERKIFSPSELAFTYEAMDVIRAHKNNGMLFGWFEICDSKVSNYPLTFTKRVWK